MNQKVNKFKFFLLLVILCFPMFSTETKSETLDGVVVSVTDGDTLTVLDADKREHVVRLFAIDAPETSCHAQKPSAFDDACQERAQPFGHSAKKTLSSMVFGKEVRVDVQPGRTYGREIGTVWVGNINANLELVRSGYAWMYRQYAKRGLASADFQEMEDAERKAQEKGIGLWSNPNPTPPWDYRHGGAK